MEASPQQVAGASGQCKYDADLLQASTFEMHNMDANFPGLSVSASLPSSRHS